MTDLFDGLVVRVESRAWTVELGEEEVSCLLDPSLYRSGRRVKNPVVVGDKVRLRRDGERGVIESVLPRTNVLARSSPRGREQLQITAANVDVLVVVSAAKDPPPRRGLIDRFLVAAERNGMDAVVVLNKVDVEGGLEVKETLGIYPRLGYPLLAVSALQPALGDGVPALLDRLRGKTALFVGHSGVGKSSLLNALDTRVAARTGDLAKHGRGRHTTTSVALFRLPGGGHLIDAPGIRGFGLFDIPSGELALLMPDLRAHANACKYPDCSHDHEPHCGVRRAVDRGEIEPARYESYLRMLRNVQGRDDEDLEGVE